MPDRSFLQHFDANDLVMSATAYYLGRQTAAVHSYCERLIKAWPQLDQHVRHYIQLIVESHFERFNLSDNLALGHDMDREMWLKVQQLWKSKE